MPNIRTLPPSAKTGPAAFALAARTGRLADSAIGAVLRLSDAPDLIALAAGSPAPETFCAEAVAGIAARLLAGPGTLQYGDTSGLWELREWVAQEHGALTGQPVAPDRTVLTHGSQQALDLVCKALLDPGDTVVVDRPSYVGALQVFELFQAAVTPVPLAADSGLDEFAAGLDAGLRPKLVYVVPNFANPTGLSLSARQRRRLADLAEQFDFVIIEDDPYGPLYHDPDYESPPPVAALSERVVRLGSFSKVLFPAARLGHATAPAPLAVVMNKLKQAADLGNSTFLERIVHELVRTPSFLQNQLAGARTLYRERRDALAASLGGALAGRIEFGLPDGGFFLWAGLLGEEHPGAEGGPTCGATTLLGAALDEKVSFVPGGAFYAADPDDSRLRLSFSCATVDQLSAAGPRLARALDRAQDRAVDQGRL